MGPEAGDIETIEDNGGGTVGLSWEYVVGRPPLSNHDMLTSFQDGRNADEGISALTFGLVNNKTGEATAFHIAKDYYAILDSFPVAGTDVSPGAWRIQVNYENTFEEGSPISFQSEVFYIETASGGCKDVKKSVTSGGGGAGGTGGLKELLASWPWAAFVTLLFLSL